MRLPKNVGRKATHFKMKVNTLTILYRLYTKSMRDNLINIDSFLISPTTKFMLSYQGRSDKTYTTLVGRQKDVLKVVIGGNSIIHFGHLPDAFVNKNTLKTYLSHIKAAFYSLNYHEMGHVLFTDMTLKTLLTGVESKYLSFTMQLFNILEDPVIESAISYYVEKEHPYNTSPRKFFNYLKKTYWLPECNEYKDDNSIASFMQYLLLLVRCGKASIKANNAIFEKYSKDLVPKIRDVLKDHDPIVRQEKTVVLANYIIENIKEFDWNEIPENAAGETTTGGVSPMTVPGTAPKSTPKGSSPLKGTSLTGKAGSVEDEDEEESEEDPAGKAGAEEEEEEEAKGEKEENSKNFDTQDLEADADTLFDNDSFTDMVGCLPEHDFYIAKECYDVSDPSVINDLDAQIEQNKDAIHEIAKFLTLFKGRKRPRRVSGFNSGRLDVFRAMQNDIKQGCDTKLFQRTVANGKTADLAISLLCDNSGSMEGTKSRLTSIATLALAQACEWSHIPFECNCFTEWDDISRTIVEKSFDDSFEKAKPYFAINDNKLIRKLTKLTYIRNFYGNVEEHNIYYIWRNLREVEHETKLLFVLCDGLTCGSKEVLARLVKQIEDDGIVVIGIGLGEEAVANIYPHHKIFETEEDINQGLASYLIDTLTQYATAKR